MVHRLKEIKTKIGIVKVNMELFDNVDEFKRANNNRDIVRNDDEFSRNKSFNYDFTGIRSYDEAVDLITNGYKEALESFSDVLKITANTTRKVTFENSVVGFAPIVPYAIMGIPKAMINVKYTKIETPVIDIYYDPRFSGNTSKQKFIDTGKKLLEAICILEKSGIHVNLYYCNFKAEENDLKPDVCILKLKDSYRALDVNRITFPIAHPAMLRVFSFEWASKVPGGQYRSGYGNGFYKAYSTSVQKEIITELLGSNARYIHAESIQSKSIEEILEVIKNG